MHSVQDCGNSIVNALELPQSCTKQLMFYVHLTHALDISVGDL